MRGARAVASALRALWLLCALLGLVGAAAAAGERVDLLEVRGPITPAIAGYVERGIDQSERDGSIALVIELDTPGGLDDSMRKIMQRMIASRVPVIVYVYPPGGRAASAGMFITQAAHVAAMAPNTNIGSAHPVQLGGGSAAPDKTMTEKAENDAVAFVRAIAQTRGRNVDWVEQAVRQSVNVPAEDALRLRVIDLVAADPAALLRAVDGREVELTGGQRVRLQTADAELRPLEMTWPERLIQTISDPNIAYLLLTVGMYGLIYELANPGTWVPGTIGVIALVVALYALGTLPTNWAGVALIGLAFALFVGDIFFASSHGGLTAAGLITLLLGSLFLFSGGGPEVGVSPWVIAGVMLSSTGFFGLVVAAAVRTHRRRPVTGEEGLIGRVATVTRDLAPEGQVRVMGELWRAELAHPEVGVVPRGAKVRVDDVRGLTLVVE
ncbi:MAG TPA: nodulation protein NfeD [Chloroflexota bacterium]